MAALAQILGTVACMDCGGYHNRRTLYLQGNTPHGRLVHPLLRPRRSRLLPLEETGELRGTNRHFYSQKNSHPKAAIKGHGSSGTY